MFTLLLVLFVLFVKEYFKYGLMIEVMQYIKPLILTAHNCITHSTFLKK